MIEQGSLGVAEGVTVGSDDGADSMAADEADVPKTLSVTCEQPVRMNAPDAITLSNETLTFLIAFITQPSLSHNVVPANRRTT